MFMYVYVWMELYNRSRIRHSDALRHWWLNVTQAKQYLISGYLKYIMFLKLHGKKLQNLVDEGAFLFAF